MRVRAKKNQLHPPFTLIRYRIALGPLQFYEPTEKMFLNGIKVASVLYGRDFFIIIFNLLLFTALNSLQHKIRE